MITKSSVANFVSSLVELARDNHHDGLRFKKGSVELYEWHKGRAQAFLLCARSVKRRFMTIAADDLKIQNLIHEREERHTPETADPYTAAQMEKQLNPKEG